VARKLDPQIQRLIRRLHVQEVGKYPCYLCSRGADSYLEGTETTFGNIISSRVKYSIFICRYCIYVQSIKCRSEWDAVQDQAQANTPDITKRDTEETPESLPMWPFGVP